MATHLKILNTPGWRSWCRHCSTTQFTSR